MENKKALLKSLITRLCLIFLSVIMFFFIIVFTMDFKGNFLIYFKKNEYRMGEMIVTRIGADSYGSPHLFADGYINNIKTGIYLGLKREVIIQDKYLVLYRPDGKSSFLIKKDFQFKPLKNLCYGILELLSIPILILIQFKIFKYFKNVNNQL